MIGLTQYQENSVFKQFVGNFQSLISLTGLTVNFSNEIQAQRRRKGSGPQGRAEKPVFRPGGTGGGTGGSGGGGFRPSFGGGGGRGFRIPLWMILVIIVLLLLCSGGGFLKQLLSGGLDTGYYEDQSYSSDVEVSSPEDQSEPEIGFTPPAGSQEGSWTVMLYQDADDKILEQDIFTDFNEAERVGSTDEVHIVAQLDRYQGAFSGDNNWTSTRRYYLTQDDDLNAIHSQLVDDLGEVNMSDPETLVDFVVWAAQTFPSDHYVLILSDHGMGWPGGWTDSASGRYSSEQAPIAQVLGSAMYLDQLDDALAQIQQQTGIEKFDIIGMDACLMAQLEVFSALEPYANYAIASEETEPALGWAYAAFLQALTQNPGMSAADLSRLVVQSYIDEDQRIVDDEARMAYLYQMGGGSVSAERLAQMMAKNSTLSAVDLSQIPALIDSVNDLAYTLQGSDQSEVAGARNYALSFTSIFGKSVPPSFIDLGNFVQILAQQSSDSQVRQLASQVVENIDRAVIAEKHGTSKRGATGIAIYYPNSRLYSSPYSGPQSYTVVANRFTEYSLWDDFLAFHYNDRSFEADTREAVIPSSSLPSRVPGIGDFTVSELMLSSTNAAPGNPVTMRADISGSNIGNIYLFVGYYDQEYNAIFVADTDFLESPDTQQVDGVYYPQWDSDGTFTIRFDWDPVVFTLSDGQTSTVALFTPQQYGATAADAVYSVDGIYTFADGGDRVNARLNFQDGEMVSIYGITGQEDTGAPHEIIPQMGDTFTLMEKWFMVGSQGAVEETIYQESLTTLTFNGEPFVWEETYAAEGYYIVGFIVTDLDGNSQEVYGQVLVE